VIEGSAVPFTLPSAACSQYVGKRSSPWLRMPSASAAAIERATLRALLELVRLAHSAA
jgi:hypothetical protein